MINMLLEGEEQVNRFYILFQGNFLILLYAIHANNANNV